MSNRACCRCSVDTRIIRNSCQCLRLSGRRSAAFGAPLLAMRLRPAAPQRRPPAFTCAADARRFADCGGNCSSSRRCKTPTHARPSAHLLTAGAGLRPSERTRESSRIAAAPPAFATAGTAQRRPPVARRRPHHHFLPVLPLLPPQRYTHANILITGEEEKGGAKPAAALLLTAACLHTSCCCPASAACTAVPVCTHAFMHARVGDDVKDMAETDFQ